MTEKLLLLAVAPIVLVMIVLAWFYLTAKHKRFAQLTLKGLGITISLQAGEKGNSC